jgi:hypothetical protein
MNKIVIGSLILAASSLVGCNSQLPTQSQFSASGASIRSITNATSTSNVLDLNFAFGVADAKINVGPVKGRVEVFGIPNVADGTVYNNIQAIKWISGAGDDKITFEVNQNADFDIDVDTGTSNADIQTKWIVPAGSLTAITPSLKIKTGPGQKNIGMTLESFSPEVAFSLLGDVGAGTTELKTDLQYKQGSQIAGATIDFQFGSAQGNKAELLIESEASNNNFDISPKLLSELVTKIRAFGGGTSNVKFNPQTFTGGGKIGFELNGGATFTNLDYNILGGAGMDEATLNLTTIRNSSIKSNFNIDLGQANDKLEVLFNGPQGNTNTFTGSINMGGMDDEAKLEFMGLTNYGISMDCGAGFDKAIGFINPLNCEAN